MKQHNFTVNLAGTGDSEGEAWTDAVDAFCADPGEPTTFPDLGQHPEGIEPTYTVIIPCIGLNQLNYQIKALHNLSGTVPYELEGAINLLESIKDDILNQKQEAGR